MSLKGIHIKEGATGANVSGDSREFALVVMGKEVTGKLEYDTAYRIRRLSDAIAIGIDSDYDATNKIHLHRHISEFYRIAGEGKILNLMIVEEQTGGNVVQAAEMAEKAKMMIADSTLISDIAFAFNFPDTTVFETTVDGLSPHVKGGIEEGQKLAQWCDDNDMPLHVIVEGRNISDTLSGLINLREYTKVVDTENVRMDAEKVTVVVGQDWRYADQFKDNGATKDLRKTYADVGTFLGCVAAQAWNRNPAEVETMGLTDSVQGEWVIGGLSNHKKYLEVFESLETIDEKGYVFPIRYTGVSGYWWNGGHCCVPIVLDSKGNINQHEIFYSHTIDMSKRALRITYLPEVKKPVPLEGGKLGTDMLKYYDSLGNMVFERMSSSGLISEGRTITDSDSDLLIEKVLKVSFQVVPTGMVNYIDGTINLKSS
jgi:hypothetical protein